MPFSFVSRRIGRRGAKAGEKMPMVMILRNQDRVTRLRMFVPAVWHQYHRANFSRASPEFREQLAAHVNVLLPLVVLYARRMRDGAPVEHRVHFGQFFFER